MPGSRSALRAEDLAISGHNESQDSQQVLEAYMRQYGNDIVASSQLTLAAEMSAPRTKQYNRSTPPPRGVEPNGEPICCREPRDATAHDRDLARTSPTNISKPTNGTVVEKALTDQRSVRQSPEPSWNWKGIEDVDAADSIATGPPGSSACPTKMDDPDSPTQSNGSRSYDQYCPDSEGLGPGMPYDSAQHPPPLSQTTSHEPRSLLDDDTGAVNFDLDNIAGTQTAECPTSDGSGAVHLSTQSPREQSIRPFWPPPETPAPVQNPFSKGRSQLLPTSQLFKHTQFSSAVRLQFSPTSSRPSPNDFLNNSISPNIFSTPVKDRGLPDLPFQATSSPQYPLGASSSRPEGEQDTPDSREHAKDPTAHDSLRNAFPVTRTAPGPMDVYVPMQKSQERRRTSDARSEPSPSSSIDGDSAIDRRRRARLKKEAALKQLTSISFSRQPRSDDVEVPSTNSKRLLRTRRRTQDHPSSQRHGGGQTSDDLQPPDTVENSQSQPEVPTKCSTHQRLRSGWSTRHSEGIQAAEEGVSMSSIPAIPKDSGRGKSACNQSHVCTDIDLSNGDAIPETSPIDKRIGNFSSMPAKASSGIPESPGRIVSKPTPGEQAAPEIPPFPSLPTASSLERPSAARSAKDNYLGLPELASSIPGVEDSGAREDSSPRLPELNAHQASHLASSPPAFSNRHLEAPIEKAPAAPSSPQPPAPLDSTSTLSVLSSTPSLSASTTPATPASVLANKVPDSVRDASNSSPTIARKRRRQEEGILPRLKTAVEENLRAPGRFTRRRLSCSTDELGRSPSLTPTFEQSLRNSRASTSRPVRSSTKPQNISRDQSCRGAKVFEGTAFAISFQSRRPGESADQYGDRMRLAEAIEAKLSRAGGRILQNGFDELFEIQPVTSAAASPSSVSEPDSEIKLAASARSMGFTALIADGHSRKVKYMQALALGLPCIATRWVTACLDRNELVDWSPYLLCAGQSTFLGDAIRSRNLAPYDASEATLASVVERRPRLLAGSRILLAMKKPEETKKVAYVFLARVLGASLSRVYTLDEARECLRAMEDLGRPFDWVYVDEKVAGEGALFPPVAAPAKNGGAGRKRKREAAKAPRSVGPSPKRVRTLSNELVIQSLILGRLIEEGEMDE